MKRFEIELRDSSRNVTETWSGQMLTETWHQHTCSAQHCYQLRFAKDAISANCTKASTVKQAMPVVKNNRWWMDNIKENNFSYCTYFAVESCEHIFNLQKTGWWIPEKEQRVVLGYFGLCVSPWACALEKNGRWNLQNWYLLPKFSSWENLAGSGSHGVCLGDLSFIEDLAIKGQGTQSADNLQLLWLQGPLQLSSWDHCPPRQPQPMPKCGRKYQGPSIRQSFCTGVPCWRDFS